MTDASRAEREALLEGLVTGARAADDPAIVRAFAADPSLREDWQELRGLAEALDGGGDRVRAEMATARRQVTADDRALAAACLRGHAHVRPAWRPRPALLVAAAVVLAAVLFAWSRWASPGVELPEYIGSGSSVVLSPKGKVDDYATFTWSKPAPRGGYSVVRVFDADAGSGAPPLAVSDEIEDKAWSPTASQLAALRRVQRLRCELVHFDADGRSDVVGATEVWR